MQRELLENLYKSDELEALLKESEYTIRRRKECTQMVESLTKASEIVNTVGQKLMSSMVGASGYKVDIPTVYGSDIHINHSKGNSSSVASSGVGSSSAGVGVSSRDVFSSSDLWQLSDYQRSSLVVRQVDVLLVGLYLLVLQMFFVFQGGLYCFLSI